MIAIVDYGVGNLYSIQRSLDYIGADSVVTGEKEIICKADKIILPGVGAFGDAIEKLRSTGLDKVIVEQAQKGKPLLGICLGMQMLFDQSYEYGQHEGLGLIRGQVKPLFGDKKYDLKVPQIGWNSLQFVQECPLLKYIKNGDFVYFVHSYSAQNCDNSVVATTQYGHEVTAIVSSNNVYGTQFHPEKSGKVGLNILKAFCEV